MYKPLAELEYANTNSRIQLTKALARDHRVRTVGGPGEETEDQCRGLAFFFAFDPWETCIRCPPGSARFFDTAEKSGLILPKEADQVSRALVWHGAEMARVYNGVFSRFFNETRIRAIIENRNNLDELSESGLAVGTSWADRLFENCPFPLQPSKHLEVHSFRQVTMEGEVEAYSQTPWLAWIEALDLACLGPWGGITSETVITMMETLEQRVTKLPEEVALPKDEPLGRKVIIPMFSRGLQGVVTGIFTDVPKGEMERILTSLTQFGETLSDAYADLRCRHFIEALDTDLDEAMLAREIINIVSPVSRLVVSREGRRAGYKIGYEGSYWSGYEPMTLQELEAETSEAAFSVEGPRGAEILIEPLKDVPHINADFTRIRIENYLSQVFGAISATSNGQVLARHEVEDILSEYIHHKDDPDASLAKLRQFYVVDKIARNWENGGVKVTNNELRGFFETQGRDAKTGYQVTSFGFEFEKIFSGRVTTTKTRNALSLAWIKGS